MNLVEKSTISLGSTRAFSNTIPPVNSSSYLNLLTPQMTLTTGQDGRRRDLPSPTDLLAELWEVCAISIPLMSTTTNFEKAVGPLLGAAFVGLAAEFNVPLATFIQGVQGGLIVAIAFGSLICNSLAVKFGKRPIYLFTTLVLMVTCFWCAAAKSFASLVAARAVQGFCMGPLEALIPASIADVWWGIQFLCPLEAPVLMPLGLSMNVVTGPQYSIWEYLVA